MYINYIFKQQYHMSPDSQPHHSEIHPHHVRSCHVGSSSNVAQFGQQVQLQSTPNQPPQIFSFMDNYHNMSAQFPYQQVLSTYTDFPLQGNTFSLGPP